MNRRLFENGISEKACLPVDRKLRGRGGFTLAETLLAVLILLLVSIVVATGMPAVTNAYNKVILGADAKVMLSTAITALHDEIGTAWDVKQIDGGLSYFSASTGAKTTLTKDSDGKLWVEEYISLNDDLIHDLDEATLEQNHKDKGHLLVADSSSFGYVTCDDNGISYDTTNGIVTIKGLRVCKKSDDSDLLKFLGEDGAKLDLTIRVISKDAVESGT